MENVTTFLDNLGILSTTGLFGDAFSFLAASGNWADAVAKLIGQVGS